MALADGISFTAAAAGTGAFVFGSARPSFLTLAQGGLSNGQTVSYLAQDALASPTQREWGHGTFNSSGSGSITRTTVIGTVNAGVAGSGVALSFNIPPIVSLTALAEDIVTATSLQVATTPIGGGTTGRILYDNAAVLGELIVGTNLSISSSGVLNATSSAATITVGATPIASGTNQRLLFDNSAVLGELIIGTNLSISGGNTLNAAAGGIAIGTTAVTGGAANRLLFDNAGVAGELILGTNLSIAGGNTLNASGGSGTVTVATLDLDYAAYNTTLANVTGINNSLSVSITSGTSYKFEIVLQMVTPSGQSGGTLVPIPNGGIQVALGGTASVNYLSVAGTGTDDITPFVVNTQTIGVSTPLTSVSPLISYVGTGQFPIAIIKGVLTCSGTGTMTVQFAQAANPPPAGGLPSAVLQGSYIELIPTTITANSGTSVNRFSPQFTGRNVTLSGNNLTVTRGATGGSDTVVMGRNFHAQNPATGKFYAEFVFTAGSVSNQSQRFGIASLAKWVGRDLGGDNQSISFLLNGTSLVAAYANAAQATYSGYTAFTNSTVFQMAVDVGAQKVWVNANSSQWNGAGIGSQNPATGLGGFSFAPGTIGVAHSITGGPVSAAVELLDTSAVVSANFGSSAYAFTPPAGFGNW